LLGWSRPTLIAFTTLSRSPRKTGNFRFGFTAFSCQRWNNASIPMALKLTPAAEFVISKIKSLNEKKNIYILKMSSSYRIDLTLGKSLL
jgi:hypothetical protein